VQSVKYNKYCLYMSIQPLASSTITSQKSQAHNLGLRYKSYVILCFWYIYLYISFRFWPWFHLKLHFVIMKTIISVVILAVLIVAVTSRIPRYHHKLSDDGPRYNNRRSDGGPSYQYKLADKRGMFPFIGTDFFY